MGLDTFSPGRNVAGDNEYKYLQVLIDHCKVVQKIICYSLLNTERKSVGLDLVSNASG